MSGMIQILFRGVDPSYSLTVGPAPFFDFAGPLLRRGDTGATVAIHRNFEWEVFGQHYTGFECAGPAVIRFEDHGKVQSESLGPLLRFWAADGMLYVDEQRFAKFDESTGLWRNQIDNTSWPAIIVESTLSPGT